MNKKWTEKKVETFSAYSKVKPKKVVVENKATFFFYKADMIIIEIPGTPKKQLLVLSGSKAWITLKTK